MRSLALWLLVGCYQGAPGPGAPSSSPPPPSPSPTAAVTPTPTAPTASTTAAAGDACASDAECVVSNWPGCCACPQCSDVDPVARSAAALAAGQAACKTMRCNLSICDIAGMCPPGEDAALFAARCRAGRCVGERR